MKHTSRNFNIGDLRSGQFCDLSIISQWETNERRLFWTKTIQNTRKHRFTGTIDILSRNIVTVDPSSCRQGHFRSYGRSPAVFFAITFDRGQLEQWRHHRCVYADDTDRLICNMTFSDQVMTLTLRSNFQHEVSRSIYIYHSTRLDKKNTMLVKSISWLYWVRSYYRKSFYLKNDFLEFSLYSG